MKEVDFYHELLNETEIQFSKSPIFESRKGKPQWRFAICDTPLRKGEPVLMGINWGVGRDNDNYEWARPEYPTGESSDDYWFSKPILPYLQKYLGYDSIRQLNYTNACFFRSKSIDQLTTRDWELSLPLLEKYLEYIDPPWILLLGTSSGDLLKKLRVLDVKWESIQEPGRSKVYGGNGKLFNKFRLMCIPHPQSHISNEEREQIWEKVVGVERSR